MHCCVNDCTTVFQISTGRRYHAECFAPASQFTQRRSEPITLKSAKRFWPNSEDLVLMSQYLMTSYPASTNASATAGTPTETSSFRCLICNIRCPAAQHRKLLRCTHTVCTMCTQAQRTNAIMNEQEGFPRYVIPGCDTYTSDAAISAVVTPQVARRMRQLQGQNPERAADGRRIWCITPECYEPLPPTQSPALSGRDGETYIDYAKSTRSTCPECGQGSRMRCGIESHEGMCTTPLPCGRQRLIYNECAVGRVMACPRCGVHVERDGSCKRMSCPSCKKTLTLKPFETQKEGEGKPLVVDPKRAWTKHVTWVNSFKLLWVVSYTMILSVHLSKTQAEPYSLSSPPWNIFLFFPGAILMIVCVFSVMSACCELLPLIGVHVPGSMWNLVSNIAVSVAFLFMETNSSFCFSRSPKIAYTLQWLFCNVPSVICSLAVFVMTVMNIGIFRSKAYVAPRQRHSYDAIDDMTSV